MLNSSGKISCEKVYHFRVSFPVHGINTFLPTATSAHHREDRLDANFAILWSKCISFLPIKTKKQTSDPTKQTQTLQFYRLILLANSMSPCTSTSMRRPIQRRQVIRVSSFSPTHERHGSHFKYSKCEKNK